MEEYEVYIDSSNKYWKQALENLKAGHFEKASEFAWGSIAIRIKALSLRKTGNYIETHKGIRDYINKISFQLKDESMYKTFREIEVLHRNFYEADLTSKDVVEAIQKAGELIAKIDNLIIK